MPCCAPLARRTAAPAASPNSTHVLRSCQSTNALIFSAPMISAVSTEPDSTNFLPASSA